MFPDSLSDPAWQGISAILAFLGLVVVVLPAGVGILRKRRQMAEEEREVIRRLFVVLDDRDILTESVGRVAVEPPDWVARSAVITRTGLTDAIQQLNEKSDALQSLWVMRNACRKFLTESERYQEYFRSSLSPKGFFRGSPSDEEWIAYEKAINDLQEVFKIHMDELRSKYEIAKKPDNGREDRNGPVRN